jgi:hypothetical protein
MLKGFTFFSATDHISASSPWLKCRGHLENVSRRSFYKYGAASATSDTDIQDGRGGGERTA